MKDKYVLKNPDRSVLLHVFLLLMVAIILLPVCVAGVKLLKDKPGNVLKLPGSSQKMDVCQLRNCMGQRTSLLL